MREGILYFKPGNDRKEVIYLPRVLINDVINQIHLEMGHQGAYKVIGYVKDRFYWTGIGREVKHVLKGCHECQMTKGDNKRFVGPCRPIVTDDIGDIVMTDLYGPLPTGKFGMNYILVVQDSFSKFAKFYALRKATTRAIISRIRHFNQIIKPKAILSDNGSQYTSKEWNKFLQEEGIRIIHTTVRNPRPNSVERLNREIGRLFRVYCGKNHKSWVSLLPQLEVLYNNTNHNSTGYTPCEIMYGRAVELTFDKEIKYKKVLDVSEIRARARGNLRKNAEYRRKKFDRSYRIINYQIGVWVKVRKLNKSDADQNITKKFAPIYEGPYVVAAVPYQNVYVLVDPKTNEERGKFNTIHLSKYYR